MSGGATVKETAMRRTSMAAIGAALIALASPASGLEARAPAPPAGPTMLGAGTTIVPVRLDGGRGVRRGARAELAIEGLAFDAPPGLLYQVSLQAPNGRRAAVGLINFYNETAPGYGGGAQPAGRRTFDVTAALRSLGGAANALVFEPTAGVAGPGVQVRVNPAARVRFESASLRWR